jgi:hypothetical protein
VQSQIFPANQHRSSQSHQGQAAIGRQTPTTTVAIHCIIFTPSI